MRERDESPHLAVGAGAPSDPEESEESDLAGDVVQAVAEFLDDLIDDPGFASDPPPPA